MPTMNTNTNTNTNLHTHEECCDLCGAVTHTDALFRVLTWNGEQRWCPDCVEDGAYECANCGVLVAASRARYDAVSGDRLCPECYNRLIDERSAHDYSHWECDCCEEDTRTTIHGYSYKPKARISKRSNEPDDELTLGVELEVDTRDDDIERYDCAQRIVDLTDRVYLKNDGSLDHGFEIVSHPGTLAHHMYELPWKGICRKAERAGFRSHDIGTCGLHVHVGRQQLGDTLEERDDVIRKITILVKRYWPEMLRFSRRTRSQVSDWAQEPDIWYRPDASAGRVLNQYIRVANDHGDRYYAINCENEATVEFRLFRGTLRRDTLIATLQLVWNICEYAKAHSVDDIQHSAWLDVARFRRWTELDAYLVTRRLAPAEAEAEAQTSPAGRVPDFTSGDAVGVDLDWGRDCCDE